MLGGDGRAASPGHSAKYGIYGFNYQSYFGFSACTGKRRKMCFVYILHLYT